MTSINAATTHRIKKTKNPAIRTKKSSTLKSQSKGGGGSSGTRSSLTTREPSAPKLNPRHLTTPSSISNLHSLPLDDAKSQILAHLSHALGTRHNFSDGISQPHTASTTGDRMAAAADVAVAVKELGTVVVLKRWGVLSELERVLIPQGIGNTFRNEDKKGSGMRRIVSASSLASLGSETSSFGTDSKKGLTTPSVAREGALLTLRAICEIVGRPSEPFTVPLLAAVIDESRSSNGPVRDAAEDTARAIITLANPLSTRPIICPVLFAALEGSPEWRVKQHALQRLRQLATSKTQAHKDEISVLLPRLIPVVTSQVWDTKPQVTKAAASCLLAACETNKNPDVAPAIPAVVNAIVKPSETMRAVEELMATTFVAPVDASTLAILCPILSRGLKEKMALSKRSCCIVIENMSRLVDSPRAVAPFGPLLVPDLKKVVENVQFEEMRDVALAALKTLTKALGHSSVEEAYAAIMAEESERVAEEERRIAEEREEKRLRLELLQKQEEEERKQWKEAMEAHRLLEQMKEKEEEEKKAEEMRKKELSKQNVKKGGKCQGCGLKKCKKTCLFYSK